MATQRDRIEQYIRTQYGTEPDYPWDKFDDSAVYRHASNRKWFALVMSVRRDKLDINEPDSREVADVINLKISDPILHDMVTQDAGIIPSYHMNKRNWISVILDDTVPDDQVTGLIDISYSSTQPKKRRHKDRAPKEWIIPSNPKYYDVVGAFEKEDEINWKQGAGIRPGDTVYLYVAAPISAILYKCKVTEIDIPYDYEDGNLTIKALMKIRLERRYDPAEFTFDVLRDEYGIFAVRGPRGVPNSLSEALNG